ncbi:MAG: formyltetrahydrofolate deformylase [Cyclobacteriaceae bacterium]|nr:formyltetrahydrofolate deformylase [Cyclobacteriaceae bacterium]
MNFSVLLIHCPDQPGLVFKITQVAYRHNLNIISNGEFVERNSNHFFMRTAFSGSFDEAIFLSELQAALPPEAVVKLSLRKKRDLCILVTKEHHCISDLLVRHAFGELDANIKCVISNYSDLERLTSKFDVPYHHVAHENKTREAHEEEILHILDHYNPEFLVLAKYMRILTPAFIQRYPNRIINIHHSFLPAFAGANPYTQAYDRGVKIIGATAHFVNEQLDEGPIIAQSIIPVAHTHSAKEMAQAGRDVEKIVLARSLKLVVHDQLFVHRNKTIIFD